MVDIHLTKNFLVFEGTQRFIIVFNGPYSEPTESRNKPRNRNVKIICITT